MTPLKIFVLFIILNRISALIFDKRFDAWYHLGKAKIFKDQETGHKTLLLITAFFSLWLFMFNCQ